MIFKLLRNETIKMLNSKKNYVLVGFLTFMIIAIVCITFKSQAEVMNNLPGSEKFPEAIKNDLINMNGVTYLKQFSIEFIFRPIVPYFIFFMVAYSVDTFGEDFYSGNMKFFANIDKKRSNIFNAKVLSLFVYGFLVVALNLVLGFIISSLVFKISFHGLFRIIIIYASSIIPVVSFGLIIGIISMFIQNRTISFALGIAASIFLTVSDRLTITSKFSPVGILALVEKIRLTNINLSELLIANLTSCVYLAVVYFIGKNIFKNKEFKY